VVCPGIVYRRDAIDWQHTGTPHQLDLWRVTRRAMSEDDMDEMIAILLRALTPGLPVRQRQRAHPYTRSGRQVDVCHGGRWVEVGECGLADPGVLAADGLPGRSGLALGMGLDRSPTLPPTPCATASTGHCTKECGANGPAKLRVTHPRPRSLRT
jgi:phenylalanyl-tRNA synthetase alpha chain